jgi:hypothetical protein
VLGLFTASNIAYLWVHLSAMSLFNTYVFI